MKHDFRTIRLVLAIAWIISLLALPVYAKDAPGVTSDQALQLLKEGNERFAADHPGSKDLGSVKRHELTGGQHPFAVVLTCSDSRVPPEIVFDRGLGEIFVVRVAGNVGEPFALGSIDYAVEHLHVPLIVVLGHDQCGAVAAAMGEHKPEGNLGKLLEEVHLGEHLSANRDEAMAGAVQNNAVHQAELLTAHSEIIRELVGQKKVRVVTAIYHLDSGKVHWIESK